MESSIYRKFLKKGDSQDSFARRPFYRGTLATDMLYTDTGLAPARSKEFPLYNFSNTSSSVPSLPVPKARAQSARTHRRVPVGASSPYENAATPPDKPPVIRPASGSASRSDGRIGVTRAGKITGRKVNSATTASTHTTAFRHHFEQAIQKQYEVTHDTEQTYLERLRAIDPDSAILASELELAIQAEYDEDAQELKRALSSRGIDYSDCGDDEDRLRWRLLGRSHLPPSLSSPPSSPLIDLPLDYGGERSEDYTDDRPNSNFTASAALPNELSIKQTASPRPPTPSGKAKARPASSRPVRPVQEKAVARPSRPATARPNNRTATARREFLSAPNRGSEGGLQEWLSKSPLKPEERPLTMKEGGWVGRESSATTTTTTTTTAETISTSSSIFSTTNTATTTTTNSNAIFTRPEGRSAQPHKGAAQRPSTRRPASAAAFRINGDSTSANAHIYTRPSREGVKSARRAREDPRKLATNKLTSTTATTRATVTADTTHPNAATTATFVHRPAVHSPAPRAKSALHRSNNVTAGSTNNTPTPTFITSTTLTNADTDITTFLATTTTITTANTTNTTTSMTMSSNREAHALASRVAREEEWRHAKLEEKRLVMAKRATATGDPDEDALGELRRGLLDAGEAYNRTKNEGDAKAEVLKRMFRDQRAATDVQDRTLAADSEGFAEVDQRQQVFDEAQAKLSATLREGGALEAEIAERTSALQAQRGKVNALTIAPPWLDVQEKRLLNRAKHEDPEAAQLAELTVAAARGDKGAAVKVWEHKLAMVKERTGARDFPEFLRCLSCRYQETLLLTNRREALLKGFKNLAEESETLQGNLMSAGQKSIAERVEKETGIEAAMVTAQAQLDDYERRGGIISRKRVAHLRLALSLQGTLAGLLQRLQHSQTLAQPRGFASPGSGATRWSKALRAGAAVRGWLGTEDVDWGELEEEEDELLRSLPLMLAVLSRGMGRLIAVPRLVPKRTVELTAAVGVAAPTHKAGPRRLEIRRQETGGIDVPSVLSGTEMTALGEPELEDEEYGTEGSEIDKEGVDGGDAEGVGLDAGDREAGETEMQGPEVAGDFAPRHEASHVAHSSALREALNPEQPKPMALAIPVADLPEVGPLDTLPLTSINLLQSIIELL